MDVDGCPIPGDRRYDLEHEVWWKPDPDGRTALVGIIAPLASFAGIFVSATFRPVSGVVAAGRSIATLESLRFTGAVRLPLDAEVVDRNERLTARPRLLNDSPYADGWVARVRPSSSATAPSRLETAEEIAARLAETIRTRRIRCWPKPPDLELSEVGLECSAVLAHLNDVVRGRAAGDTVLLVTDDSTSPIEMVRWSDQTGYPVLAHRQEGLLHRFLVEKIAAPVPRRRR